VETIYSVGYSGRTLDELVTILEDSGLKTLVDVRSFPSSRKTDFDKNVLEAELPKRGIEYLHLPGLGGYRDQPYRKYTDTEEFEKHLEKLEEAAREKQTAFMCLERDPADCHRRHISHALKQRGWTVRHLVEPGETQATL